MGKDSWSKIIQTTGGPVELSSYKTSDGSTTIMEKRSDGSYTSIHMNETNPKYNVRVHYHNSDGSCNGKIDYDKNGNYIGPVKK